MATPIGNLADVTFRAIEVLQEVDLVLAEDTRQASKLFQRYGISTLREAFHDFNKEKKTPKIIQKLKQGKEVALISEAGTPGISDPGFYLVREAIKQGIEVSPVPGPTACISALTISGFPTARFAFEGFLPRKAGRRRKRLRELKVEPRTIILYESPHRLKKTLQEIRDYLGNRKVCLVREMTKIHEQCIRGWLDEILERIRKQELVVRGEFVIVIEGRPEPAGRNNFLTPGIKVNKIRL